MRAHEGVVKVKRVCKNAKLPMRGAIGAARYGLAVVQATIVLVHGEVLVKIGLSMGPTSLMLW